MVQPHSKSHLSQKNITDEVRKHCTLDAYRVSCMCACIH